MVGWRCVFGPSDGGSGVPEAWCPRLSLWLAMAAHWPTVADIRRGNESPCRFLAEIFHRFTYTDTGLSSENGCKDGY